MATVTEAVKESLIGSTSSAEISNESRVNFLAHAKQGEDGESYMDEEAFINAIAPESEDYVSNPTPFRRVRELTVVAAQNRANSIWHPLSSRRPTEAGQNYDV